MINKLFSHNSRKLILMGFGVLECFLMGLNRSILSRATRSATCGLTRPTSPSPHTPPSSSRGVSDGGDAVKVTQR